MLPHLPSSDLPVPVYVPASPRFRAPVGKIEDVKVAKGNEETQAGTSSAQKAGLAYESRIQRALCGQFGEAYRRSPYVHFSDDSGRRTCIPDGIILGHSFPTIVEIKYQHMPESWWQLRRLYQPVLEKFFATKVRLLEICRSFDAHMPFPEEPVMVYDVQEFLNAAAPGDFGVLRWKP